MKIWLYRRRLSLTSGAGQLIRMQLEGLTAAGENARAVCRRGLVRFALTTRLPVRRASIRALGSRAASPGHLVVDHQAAVPQADLVFVHNLMSEAVRHLDREDWRQAAARESAFFAALRPDALVVANSELVRRGLFEHFGLRPDRVVVEYPGFRSDSFKPRHVSLADAERHHLDKREAARASLGLAGDTLLIGFVTSGELDKRGADIFLASAERIARERRDARFLIVGSKRLPQPLARHPLLDDGRVIYRPKSRHPERWFYALDLFLYPARFEEFGMVVAEALASGLPVLTSRRVGAAECLPPVYQPWLLEEPDSAAFADLTLALLGDDAARRRLATAGAEAIAGYDGKSYATRTVALIRKYARRKGESARVRIDNSGTH